MALTVEDRLEILDLYSRWCVTIDDGDVEGWTNTFHVDGVFEKVGEEPVFRVMGHDRIRELGAAVWAQDCGMQRHICTNVLVEGDGDAASGRADAQVLELRTGGDVRIIKTARYNDRLERRDGVWRLAHRSVLWDTPHIPDQPAVEGSEPFFQTAGSLSDS